MTSETLTAKELAVLQTVMRKLGARGGRASAAALTPAQRKARAAKAGRARYAMKGGQK